MRSVLAAGLLAGVVMASTAIAQEAGGAPADSQPAESGARDYGAGTVLATVNGTDITLGHLITLREQLPPQYQSLPDDVLFSGLLDQLVDQELLAAEQSDSGGDPLSVKLQIENNRRSALAAMAVQSAVKDAVDDAAVQTAYQAQTQSFQPQPEFNAAHILVDSEDKAKELKAEIDDGADFAELAQANSSDGSAASGGDLGWFGLGQMVPEFEAAVKDMAVGEVAGPVQTQFGWHLIKLNEKRDSAPPPLEQMRPEIENQLRQQALEAKLEALRAEAQIERPETGLPPAAIRETDLLTN